MRVASTLAGAVLGQLFGDGLCLLYLFSPIVQMGALSQHQVLAVLLITVPVPVGALVGALRPTRTIWLVRHLRLRTWSAQWSGAHSAHPTNDRLQYMRRRRWQFSIGAGLFVLLAYTSWLLLGEGKPLAYSIAGGTITGLIACSGVSFALGKALKS